MPFAATWMDLDIITLTEVRKIDTIWYNLYVESKIQIYLQSRLRYREQTCLKGRAVGEGRRGRLGLRLPTINIEYRMDKQRAAA